MAYDILVNGADPATTEVKYADELTKKFMKDRAETMGITIPEGYEELAPEAE